jgi:hypothetical protein
MIPLSEILVFLEQDLQDVFSLAIDPSLVLEHLIRLRDHMDLESTTDYLETRAKRASVLAGEISYALTKAMDLIRPGGCIEESCLKELSKHLGEIVEKIPLLLSSRSAG